MKTKYRVEKHITTEYIVVAIREGENIPVAKCNNEGTALTIKGLYEKMEVEELCTDDCPFETFKDA